MPSIVSWLRPASLVLMLASSAGAQDALGTLNCTACHGASQAQAAWLLPAGAPRLEDVGRRASPEWLQHFLAAPHETLPGTTMPDVLHGNLGHAEALTHFLLSQS